MARAGDHSLVNHDVTAIVRDRDGALIDFYRHESVLPTTDQLGATTGLDGVWEIKPWAESADGWADSPERAVVGRDRDGLNAHAIFTRRGRAIHVVTRYRLDPARASLTIECVFSSEPGLPADVRFGLSVRWGNTGYSVPGEPAPLADFSGVVAWAGRHGAGGDLLLQAREPDTFQAVFETAKRGFQGPLRALVRGTPGQRSLRVRYALAYRSLPAGPPAPAEPTGELQAEIRDERGRPLAGKLTLLRDGKAEPIFPDDGGIEGASRFVWTGNGTLSARLPVGRYEVLASAGPERELFRRPLTISTQKAAQARFTLKRVVPTPGWIAADLHLHQAPSVDADISFDNRLIAVAAEGVELAVATDHYAVSDLAPTLEALVESGAMARPITTVVGSEVSTLGERFGHFNAFPLPKDASIEYWDMTPKRLFAAARAAAPEGILQVNHPRWNAALGYFTRYDLDPTSAQPRKPGFDPGFDAIEVYNGYEAEHRDQVELVLQDFLHLLGQGRRYVATGSSDSHKLAFLDPGVPRTYIFHGAGRDDETDARAPVDRVLQALREGRAIVSSGPFIDAHVGRFGPGQTASGLGKVAKLRVVVSAPSWVDTARVRVLEGPTGRVAYDRPIPPGPRTVRFDRTLSVPLTGPTFLVVTVTGERPLPNTFREDILPFAFTNPIWVEP